MIPGGRATTTPAGPRLRTDGVDTNGGAAEVRILTDSEKGAPWHFWGDKCRLAGVPKNSLCQKT